MINTNFIIFIKIFKKTTLQLSPHCCILIWYCILNLWRCISCLILSQLKRELKVIAKKTQINTAHKTALKTAVKKFEAAVADGDQENAKVLFNDAVKQVG